MNNKNIELLSIVVPAYNEAEVLPIFHSRLITALKDLHLNFEALYVNDGSKDETFNILKELRNNDERIAILDLSRNYGKEIALSAGLQQANGDVIVVIDADLQDPPELIPEFIKEWKNGYDVVYGKRLERTGESITKKLTAHVFYRIIQKLNDVKVPTDTGDFRLLSRRAVDAVNAMKEHHRFMKGIFTWIGYPQKAVEYVRTPRNAGKTKWNYRKLFTLAIEGITSFSTIPLRIFTYLGMITALGAFMYGLYMIVETLIHGNPVAGYPSLIVVVLFMGGIQLISLGIIGEYLGRVFNETKQRPLYFIQNYLPPKNKNSV